MFEFTLARAFTELGCCESRIGEVRSQSSAGQFMTAIFFFCPCPCVMLKFQPLLRREERHQQANRCRGAEKKRVQANCILE